MKISICEILNFYKETKLQVEYHGKDDLVIESFCSLNHLKSNAITWIKKSNDFDYNRFDGISNLLIVASQLPPFEIPKHLNFIIYNYPKEAFFAMLAYFFSNAVTAKISEKATVLTDKIGKNVSIGAGSYICEEVIIGDNVHIGQNVSIECKTYIGNNSNIDSGTIIGVAGHGYYRNMEGKMVHVNHYGGVWIGCNTDIGANCVIDRGTIDDTYIGNNVNINSLCQISHNVRIDDRCAILSSLGGSCIIGKDSYIAPLSYVMNQMTVGQHCFVNSGTFLNKELKDGYIASGMPLQIFKMDYHRFIK